MSTFTSRRQAIVRTLAAAMFASTAAGQALAADFPTKPVTLVVPFAAGGSLDVTARIIADRLKEELGQTVVIMNRPGAGSSVGARAVATAPADGHTLFFTSGSAYGYAHQLVPNMDLTLKNFEPVAAVAVNPSVVVASTGSGIQSLADLASHPKASELMFCSTGAGGMNHLQLEMLSKAVKTKTGKDYPVTHVPYNGLAPALTGVRDGSVQACMLPYASLVKNLHGKELRVLAVQSNTRLPWLPDVPTTGQQGFPALDANDAYVNVAAPAGTPAAVVAKLEKAFRVTMEDETVRSKLNNLEVRIAFMGSRDTKKWLEEDVRRFTTVIREAGVSIR